MAMGWKWVANTVVWLSYSALALLWLAWLVKFPVHPITLIGSDFQHQNVDRPELPHHLDNLRNVSSCYNAFTVCMGFFSEGGASADYLTNEDTMEWSGGQWFYPLESSTPRLSEEYRVLRVGGLYEGLEATFSVSQTTSVDNGVGWGSLTHLIQTFEGHLILQGFWDEQLFQQNLNNFDYSAMGNASGLATQTRNLNISLFGAFVNTSVERRVCMTGCAYRFDHSHQLDCGFILKMTYPYRRTLTTPRIEAELSSARAADDPLYFPAFLIMGPSNATEPEYEFRSEEFLQSALNRTGSAGFLDGQSKADPEDLVPYLESFTRMYRAIIAPSPREQTLFKQQGKVVVGPFSMPCYPSKPMGLPEDIAVIEVTMQFKDIVTRASSFSGRVLVRGSMKMDISCSSSPDHTPYQEQRPFSVEGIWDTTTEELCMLGCRFDSLDSNLRYNNTIPGTSCDRKICIQSAQSVCFHRQPFGGRGSEQLVCRRSPPWSFHTADIFGRSRYCQPGWGKTYKSDDI